MIIKNITIKNFRNIGNQKIEFCDGINVIEGKNAQGKTNILEALWLFSGQKSFRGAKDNEMIKIGEQASVSEIEFFSEERGQTASLSLEKGKEYSFMVKPEFKYGYEGIGTEVSVTTILPEYEIYDTTLKKDGVDVDSVSGAGIYTVTTKVKNNLVEDGLSFEHFVAVYNEKEELVLFKSNSQTAKKTPSDAKPVSVSETFTLDEGDYRIEVFVLDSRKELNILRDCQAF